MKTPKQNTAKTMQSMHQSVRTQITNTSKTLQADLTAQVKALQAQISALQGIVDSLQQQLQDITFPTTANPTTKTTTQSEPPTEKETSTAATSPRKRAHKCPRSNNQSQQDTSATDEKFEDLPEDSTKNANPTQRTPPIDPNHGLDPGEEDSTLL